MKTYSQLTQSERAEYHRIAWRRYYYRNQKRFIKKSLKYQKEHPDRWKEINNRAAQKYKEKTRYSFMRQKLIKKFGSCQKCGTKDNLQIHHKNRKSYHNSNKPDNKPENLELLCQKCHLTHHYTNGDTLTRIGRNKVSRV